MPVAWFLVGIYQYRKPFSRVSGRLALKKYLHQQLPHSWVSQKSFYAGGCQNI
jgi:hypothetical protein